MFKITIQSQKHGHIWLLKQTQEEVDAYLQEIASSAHWGLPEREQTIDAKEAVLDQEGNILEPAVEEQVIVLPAEYTVSVSDVTEEIEREKAIAKNLARMQFGMQIMAELAYRNQKRLSLGQMTLNNILTIEESLAKVQRLLLNGSTGLALQALVELNIPELSVEEKQLFVTKIQDYLSAE